MLWTHWLPGDSITIQLGRELAKSDKCDLMWTMICDTLKESKYIPGRLDILNGIIIEQKNTDNVKRKLSVLLQDDRLIPAYIALVIKNDIFNEENNVNNFGNGISVVAFRVWGE